MVLCIKIALFPIINQNLQQNPTTRRLLHSIDSHVVFDIKQQNILLRVPRPQLEPSCSSVRTIRTPRPGSASYLHRFRLVGN